MPNRILKESICTSEEIDLLTPEQEVFFYRLMVVCDDFGLMDARPAIIKARCYPLKAVDIKRIQSLLDKLHDVGLIRLYESGGKAYLHVTNWEKHQSIRAKKPKYPYPQADDFICKQTQANVPVIQSNPIQSESNPIQSPEPDLFADAWAAYPRRPGASKADSRKAWDARIAAKVSPIDLFEGVMRYAAYCAAMNVQPEFIKQPATFFGPGEHYLSDWTPTPKGGSNGSNRESCIADFTGQGRGQPTVLDGSSYRVVEDGRSRV